MKLTYIITSLCAMSLLFSCTSKKEETATPAANQALTLHVHQVVGNDEIEYGTNYLTADGRKINFNIAQFYISNIELIKADSSTIKLSNYLMVSPATDDYLLGQIPAGSYKGIKFSVGVDAITNHSDMSKQPDGSALAPQKPGMYWSWAPGYIFMRLEGMVDTTAAATGNAQKAFAYHIGTDALLRNVTVYKDFDMVANNNRKITLLADYKKLLSNVNFNTERQTHSMGTDLPLAKKIADNMPISFTLSN